MKTLDLNIDYKRKKKESEIGPDGKEIKQKTDAELSSDYIYFAVNSTHKEGLKDQYRRLWGRIQRKLDDALEQEPSVLELEASELDFIFTAVRDAQFPANISMYVVILEDALDELRKDKDSTKTKNKE